MDNLAVDIVQISQATDMVAKTAKRITLAITALRRGNISKAVEGLWGGKAPSFRPGKAPKPGNATADNWLEMQYGWKPLLADVKGVFESLAKLNLANYSVQQVQSSAKVETIEIRDIIETSTPYRQKFGKQVITTSTICKLKLQYRLDNPFLQFLSQTGFTNPVNLAWELLPYSFVIDWFLPIGQFLEDLSAWEGLTFLRGVKVQFTRQNTYYDQYWNGPLVGTPGTEVWTMMGNFHRSVVKYDREKLSAFPRAQLPHLKNPFSPTHAANAVGLMRKAF